MCLRRKSLNILDLTIDLVYSEPHHKRPWSFEAKPQICSLSRCSTVWIRLKDDAHLKHIMTSEQGKNYTPFKMNFMQS